jgi:hypothetical protein
VVLKTELAELTQADFAALPLRLEVCLYKLKPIAVSRSKQARRRLYVGIHLRNGRGTCSLR